MKSSLLLSGNSIKSALPPDDGYQIITCSIFAPLTIWSVILTQLQQLLKDLRSDFLYSQIRFNDNNGPNIRIAIVINAEKKQKIGNAIKLKFKPLLSDVPIDDRDKKVESIFLPYPTHTVEFDQYKLYYDERLSDTYEMDHKISDFMIEVLKQNDIDLETLTTFSYYLQISLIKVLMGFDIQFEDLLKLIFIGTLEKSNFIKTESDENIQILTQISYDIMHTEIFEYELAWMNYWIKFCSGATTRHLHYNIKYYTNIENALASFYQSLSSNIHDKLGLSEKTIFFLNYTTYCSITAVVKEKTFLAKTNRIASEQIIP